MTADVLLHLWQKHETGLEDRVLNAEVRGFFDKDEDALEIFRIPCKVFFRSPFLKELHLQLDLGRPGLP